MRLELNFRERKMRGTRDTSTTAVGQRRTGGLVGVMGKESGMRSGLRTSKKSGKISLNAKLSSGSRKPKI